MIFGVPRQRRGFCGFIIIKRIASLTLYTMANEKSITRIKSELQKGMQLPKCRKCGCMKQTLENLLSVFSLNEIEGSANLVSDMQAWLTQMETVRYDCLGCDYCFPAVVTNILMADFPSMELPSLSCGSEAKEDKWPPVAGEYFAFCDGANCPVAVSTLASVDLTETLAKIKPKGLCIVGKTETENIGIDKIIKNTITNPTIRFFILAGQDPQGHQSGKTLLALSEKGVDKDMKVIDAPGRRPILKNVSFPEVESFRRQVRMIDMIGCEDTGTIVDKINDLSKKAISTCECKECFQPASSIQISSVSKIWAVKSKKSKMDKAGYFVIIPSLEKKTIIVEHYAYDNKLLHIIEGKDVPSIYSTIIENGWITELSHSAYLGRELAKAELSLKLDFKYTQDRAPGETENDTV